MAYSMVNVGPVDTSNDLMYLRLPPQREEMGNAQLPLCSGQSVADIHFFFFPFLVFHRVSEDGKRVSKIYIILPLISYI